MASAGMKETEIAQMGVVISEGEMVRRKLHNFIQELKGNIRVLHRSTHMSTF